MTEKERKQAEKDIRAAFARRNKRVVITSDGKQVVMLLSTQKRSGKVRIGAQRDGRGNESGGTLKSYNHTWIVAKPLHGLGPIFNLAPDGAKGNSKVTA